MKPALMVAFVPMISNLAFAQGPTIQGPVAHNVDESAIERATLQSPQFTNHTNLTLVHIAVTGTRTDRCSIRRDCEPRHSIYGDLIVFDRSNWTCSAWRATVQSGENARPPDVSRNRDVDCTMVGFDPGKRPLDSYPKPVPPPVVSFPAAEALMPEAAAAFEQTWAQPPPTVLRAYLVDRDWTIERNDRGVILSRAIWTRLFFRGGATGKCYGVTCSLAQEEQGGAWGRPSLACLADRKEYVEEVTCASVEALRPGVGTRSKANRSRR
jgi:hypothetical protein